jgi:hypothetical protein
MRSALKKIHKILSAKHMKTIFKYSITDSDDNLTLTFNIAQDSYNKLVNKYFSKKYFLQIEMNGVMNKSYRPIELKFKRKIISNK